MARRRIAVISDTHGLLRPEALELARNAELILHAGDVGAQSVLDALSSLAPVVAVRGNVDTGAWGLTLAPSVTIDIDGMRVHIVHAIAELAIDPVESSVALVISGHSHRASIERRDGVLYLNPGAAGPRRFTLPITMADLWIGDGTVEAEIRELVR